MKKINYIIRILIGAVLAVVAYRFIMNGTFKEIDHILIIAMPIALIIANFIQYLPREKDKD